MSTNFRFQIIDATECTEIRVFYVSGADAPNHMKKHILKTGQRKFHNVHGDTPETLGGLVDEDDIDEDRANEHAGNVCEWLEAVCTSNDEFEPSDSRQIISHYITIISA